MIKPNIVKTMNNRITGVKKHTNLFTLFPDSKNTIPLCARIIKFSCNLAYSFRNIS